MLPFPWTFAAYLEHLQSVNRLSFVAVSQLALQDDKERKDSVLHVLRYIIVTLIL